MMRPSDRIAAPSRATYDDAVAGLTRVLGSASDQARLFLDNLHEFCLIAGLDFAVLCAHAANECDWFRDPDFTRDSNAFGIGHPDGAPGGVVFASPHDGAKFAVGEYLLKLRKPIPPLIASARAAAPRKWDAVERIVGGAAGSFPSVERIADLNKRFGPNDREAVWMTDPNGPAAICQKGNALFPSLPDQEDTPPMPTPRQRPTVILDAGHRSTDRSGNPAEMALTDDLAVAYVDELRRRGYQAFWFQRDIDRDSDPDETIGDLNTVAKGLGAWLKGQPWALLLSLHYNGPHSPLHAIVPDNVGLSTAYPEGRDANDTAANNRLDVQLASEIVIRMSRGGLGDVFRGMLGPTGVMSERETGVGLDGYRLAVFSATAPARQSAVRLVIEHGGTDDPAARRFADFAAAAADAIDVVYEGEAPGPLPEPQPSPWPVTAILAPDELRAQGHVVTPLSHRRQRATQGTTLRTAPHRDAPAIGPTGDIKRGKIRSFDFAAQVDGERWFLSKRGSWSPAKVWEPV